MTDAEKIDDMLNAIVEIAAGMKMLGAEVGRHNRICGQRGMAFHLEREHAASISRSLERAATALDDCVGRVELLLRMPPEAPAVIEESKQEGPAR